MYEWEWTYQVVPERIYHADIGEYHTYGFEVTGPQCSIMLHDVSVYREVAAHMAELFNRHQLSAVHLQDALEDLLV